MTVRSALSALALAFTLSACGQQVSGPPVVQPFPLTGCESLDESACNAAPGCVSTYGEEDAPQPVPFYAVAAGCMPFEPEQPLPFHHCEALPPADPCAGLDEATCNATPGCAAVHAMAAVYAEEAGDVVAVPPSFGGCAQVPGTPEPMPVEPPVDGDVCPAVMCMLYCESGYVLDAAGCPTCACQP